MSNDIQPFRITATDSQLDDLKRRLRETRWPERECVDDWSQGLPFAYAQEVAAYWLENRAQARFSNDCPISTKN
jgi:epoxide hydrolase